jgi:hypothetical protein
LKFKILKGVNQLKYYRDAKDGKYYFKKFLKKVDQNIPQLLEKVDQNIPQLLKKVDQNSKNLAPLQLLKKLIKIYL